MFQYCSTSKYPSVHLHYQVFSFSLVAKWKLDKTNIDDYSTNNVHELNDTACVQHMHVHLQNFFRF